MLRVMTIIVLTGSSCNINCNYCYVTASRQNIKKIPVERIPALIRNCAIGFDRVEFCWHGGEPLLVGKEFYRAVIAAQKKESEKRKVTFVNGIQSNGILLDEEWISFFKANDIGLGISFNAPPETNNMHRNNTAGKILNIFSLMRRLEFSCGVICVVSKHNTDKAEEIFEFFHEQEVSSYSILPLKSVPMPFLPGLPTNEELAELYCRTFDIWASRSNKLRKIKPLYSMILGLLGKTPPSCSFSAPCPDTMIAIDQEGNVVPCGSLVEKSFILGNIFEAPLAEVVSRSTARLNTVRKDAIQEHCNSCEFVSLCLGGCRSDAYWATGRHDGAYPYCDARKITFRYLKEQLQKMKILA